MTNYFILITLFVIHVNPRTFAEILTFGKSAVPSSTTPQPTEHTGEEQEQSHLPLSSLFSQSNKYKCMIQGQKEHCTSDDVTYMNNKFGDATTQSHKDTNINNKEATVAPQQSNKNTNNKNGDAIIDKTRVYGPRYQPIHLALPRLPVYKIGHEEKIKFNNREMTIKTISHLPFIFEVTNFLSPNETELMVDMATEKGLKERSPKPSIVELWEEMNHRLYDLWDVNFDGKISVDEFNDIKELDSYLLTLQDIQELFAIIDKDFDGYLSYGELSKGGFETLKEAFKTRETKRSEQKSKGGFEAWLWHDEDELLAYEDLLEDFHQRIERITDVPEELIQRSEPINIQKFEKDAFSACQQDSEPTNKKEKCCTYGNSDCRTCRYLSIHMFLTDDHKGGELIFPIADNETFHWQNLKEDLIRKCEKIPNVTSSNLVVKPARGKAVFWYNHEVSPDTGWMGQLEARAISSIAPVLEKNAWSAKMWLNIIGDGVHELKPWRMASNWLKSPNKNKQIIEQLRNDHYREGEPYIHIYRDSYKRKVPPPQSAYKQNDFLKPPIAVIDNISSKMEGVIKTETEKDIEDKKASSQVSERNTDSEKTENESESKNQEVAATAETIVREPIGPDVGVKQTPVLGFHHKKRQEVPLGPPKRPLDPQAYTGKTVIENALLKASMLLVEELSRDELEMLARTLHDKLQLQCIPLIVNPIR